MQPPLPKLGRCPPISDPIEHSAHAAQLHEHAADVEENDPNWMRRLAHTTTLTSLPPGGTITLRTGLPSIHFWTVASANAAALISSLFALAPTSTFARSLPFTCTTTSIRSWTSACGSACGQA